MRRLGPWPLTIVLAAISVLYIFPFYWVLISSLKSVEGLSLKPPSLIPSEPRFMKLQVPGADRVFVADQIQWLRLTEVDGQVYGLQLEGGKPTQLVRSFSPGQLETDPKAASTTVNFDKVPVHRFGAKTLGIVAKIVRNNDGDVSETLFVLPEGAKDLGPLAVSNDTDHEEIRDFHARWENYPETLKGPEASIGGQSIGFITFMKNSLFISAMAVLGQVLVSSLVAFGFARLKFKGRDALFVLLLTTLMVPSQVTLIPLFTIYKNLGWIDTFLPLIVPHFTAGAFNVFLIRQFLLGFPKELDESAAIDGASPWRIYWSIILPNSTPVLIVVGLFTFVGTWQDVMGPLIYLDKPSHRTVALGLEYFRSPYVDNRHLLMAGAVLAMLPVTLLFLFAQRYIMSGIVTTGLKD